MRGGTDLGGLGGVIRPLALTLLALKQVALSRVESALIAPGFVGAGGFADGFGGLLPALQRVS